MRMRESFFWGDLDDLLKRRFEIVIIIALIVAVAFYLTIVHIPMLKVCITVILTTIAAYPLLIYFIHGWKRKADDILSAINSDAAQAYFEVFQKKKVDTGNAKQLFDEFYNNWYGRKYLVFPSAIFIFVASINAYVIGSTGEAMLHKYNGILLENPYLNVPLTACAAAAGSYAFVSWDIILRVARRNLSASDILGNTIRLSIAIPIGYAFGSLVKDEVGPFISFAVGAFPLQSVQTALQRLSNKQLGLEAVSDMASEKVTRLSGVDQTTAERIGDADINTIAQLAYCDPIQLTMRTHLPFAYISDIVGQALVWIYMGDKLDNLRLIGLRGAVEINLFIEDLVAAKLNYRLNPETGDIITNIKDDDFCTSDLSSAKACICVAILCSIPKKLGMTQAEFINTAREIAEDPYTKFLTQTW
ncbi:hypothetical protein ACQKQD_03655 [Methylobacterium sp. NPDC080182]|uniref:hypothetical protein n=1 Tax=Methylobacterium sp. NPDC080182 TaxID=3390590 RepID=UPI003D08C6AD